MVRKLDRLGVTQIRHRELRLAIMIYRHAESPGSISVRGDSHRRVDEPTPTADHRLCSRGEPGPARATRWAADAAQ